MELDAFIKTVLTNVIQGIRSAQEVQGVGAFIVPGGIGGHEYAKHPRVAVRAGLSTTIVDFDIGVTVEEGTNIKGSGGLKVAGIGGANVDGESSTRDTRVSRIQFAIPVLLPESQKQWHEELQS